jgi:enamine deaminase RidA (YjgF/YER057c/UK114 family)
MRLHLPLLALLAACAPPQPRFTPAPVPVPQRIVAPDVPQLNGMPHAVRTGLTVHVSGMVPVNAEGQLVGSALAPQTQQAMRNFLAVVTAARGVPGDVVRITAYVRDLTPDAVEVIRTAVLDATDRTNPPALTVVGVATLPEAGMQVMLEGTVQLRAEFPDRTRM